MKLLSLLVCGLLVTSIHAAETTFPGLKEVLTDAEWKRAGLDRLTPDQVGVIDAALIRHYMRAITGAGPLPRAPATPAATPAADPGAAPAGGNSFSAFFGLTKLSEIDWRTQPPLV